MKQPFCCVASAGQYEDYYTRQQKGGEVPYFAGGRYQRGHGLGSMLGGLFRRIVPFVRNNAKRWGLGLLNTGMNIAGDVIEGKKFTESAKTRLPEGIKRAARDTVWHTEPKRRADQSGEGFTKRKRRGKKTAQQKKNKQQQQKKKKRQKRTIFD
jgi:hypothetical protein